MIFSLIKLKIALGGDNAVLKLPRNPLAIYFSAILKSQYHSASLG